MSKSTVTAPVTAPALPMESTDDAALAALAASKARSEATLKAKADFAATIDAWNGTAQDKRNARRVMMRLWVAIDGGEKSPLIGTTIVFDDGSTKPFRLWLDIALSVNDAQCGKVSGIR